WLQAENEPDSRPKFVAASARSPSYWANYFAKTYDPRLRRSTIDFNLYPKQQEFLRWLAERERNGEDGLAETSRDVGFTWLCCVYATHGWLFKPGYKAGFGSRKLDL